MNQQLFKTRPIHACAPRVGTPGPCGAVSLTAAAAPAAEASGRGLGGTGVNALGREQGSQSVYCSRV